MTRIARQWPANDIVHVCWYLVDGGVIWVYFTAACQLLWYRSNMTFQSLAPWLHTANTVRPSVVPMWPHHARLPPSSVSNSLLVLNTPPVRRVPRRHVRARLTPINVYLKCMRHCMQTRMVIIIIIIKIIIRMLSPAICGANKSSTHSHNHAGSWCLVVAHC